MKKIGFKNTLLLVMAILTVLAVGLASYFNFRSFSEDFKEQLYHSTQVMVKIERDKLNEYLAFKAHTVESVAEQYRKNAYTSGHVDRMKVAAGSGDIPNLTLGLPNGDAYCSLDMPGWIGNKNPPEYNATKRPWYQQAMSTNDVFFTEPYEDATTNEKMISIGKEAGNGAVILADIPLTRLEESVNHFRGNGRVALIVDENAKVLASSSSVVGVNENISSNRSLSHIFDALKTSDSVIVDYVLNGTDKVMFAEAIQVGNKKWYIMEGLNKSIVFAKLNSLKQQAIYLTLIAAVLSMIISTLLLNALYRPIVALKNTVLSLSSGNGDLTQRLAVTSNDDLGQISGGINKFIEQLQSMMLKIENVAADLENNASALKSASDENAKVLNQHTQETEQIVTAIEEMSATANTVAQNASDSSESTQDIAHTGEVALTVLQGAKDQVASLVEDVANTSDSMKHMSDETQNISRILVVISEIAEQTNLLALNAAIEAARAGEHGRGFAVVADEVRSLASRTQKSTVEVEEALNRLLEGNKKVVGLMGNTQNTSQATYDGTEKVSETIHDLIQKVTFINDLTIQIATAAEEQSSVTEEINQNMSAVRDIVLKLNHNSENVIEQANGVSTKNAELASIVSQFKLK